MIQEKGPPSPGRDGAGESWNPKHPNRITSFSIHGFACSFCGDWFAWPELIGFGNRMRFCDGCAHAIELIHLGIDPA